MQRRALLVNAQSQWRLRRSEHRAWVNFRFVIGGGKDPSTTCGSGRCKWKIRREADEPPDTVAVRFRDGHDHGRTPGGSLRTHHTWFSHDKGSTWDVKSIQHLYSVMLLYLRWMATQMQHHVIIYHIHPLSRIFSKAQQEPLKSSLPPVTAVVTASGGLLRWHSGQPLLLKYGNSASCKFLFTALRLISSWSGTDWQSGKLHLSLSNRLRMEVVQFISLSLSCLRSSYFIRLVPELILLV